MDMLANPEMDLASYAAMDFNADNTQLLDIETYKQSKKVQQNPNLQNSQGELDEEKLKDAYSNALYTYNILANDTQLNKVKKQLVAYDPHSIFAPSDATTYKTEPVFYKRPNMLQTSYGLVGVNLQGPQTKTEDEIAQQKQVLRNPREAYNPDGTINYDKAQWAEAPEGLFTSGYWTDFWDTRVLAQWDEDGEHVDPETGEVVKHFKGQLKVDQYGTPYYENLDGRTPYGRRVLNRMNTITKESSPWNEYDFFDSDDLEEKSAAGTILRNLALIGSMFIGGGVGVAIAAASAGTQVAGMLATLGKMITLDSDNETLSQIEGWAQSWNRQYGKTQYAQTHTWCFENFVDTFADLIAQLREQRVLFQYVPAVIKGRVLDSDKAIKALEKSTLEKWKTELLNENNPLFKSMFKKAFRTTKNPTVALQTAETNMLQKAQLETTAFINALTKDYNTIGAWAGKAYMAGLISNGLYGEAKMNGLEDWEATAVTMGRFAAEMALLNTPLGEYMFPELRYKGMQLGKMGNAFFEPFKKLRPQLASAKTPEAKASWFQKMMKKAFFAEKEAQVEAMTLGEHKIKTAFTMGVEAGIVNDIEEGLNDLAKAAYNTAQWLASDSNAGFLDSTIGDKAKWKAFENSFDRYAMGMVSGIVGGGITSYVQNISPMKALAQINSNTKAMQQLINMVNNGEHQKFLDYIDKHTWGDTNLSDDFEIINGEVVYKPADSEHISQDEAFKLLMHKQVELIEQIINEEGVGATNEEFLNKALRRDLRAQMLAMRGLDGLETSPVASRYLTYYQNLIQKLIAEKGKLKESQSGQEVTDGNKKKQEAEQVVDNKAKENLKQVQKDLKDLLDGKLSKQFLNEAIFDMSMDINSLVCSNITTKNGFVFAVYGQEYDKLSDEKKREADGAWNNWNNSPYKTDIVMNISHSAHDLFQQLSKVIKESEQGYQSLSELPAIVNWLDSLTDSYQFIVDSGAELTENDSLVQAIVKAHEQSYYTIAQSQSEDAIQEYVNQDAEYRKNLADLKKDQKELINQNQDHTDIDSQIANVRLGIQQNAARMIAASMEEFLNKLETLPYLNSEMRSRLRNMLEGSQTGSQLNLHNIIAASSGITYNQLKESVPQLYVPETDEVASYQALVDFVSTIETYGLDSDLYETAKDITITADKLAGRINTIIANKSISPLETFVRQVAQATSGDAGIDQTLTQLFKLWDSNFLNLDNITVDQAYLDNLGEVRRILSIAKAAILAARTDQQSITDVFGGYNAVLNNINKGEGWEELAEIQGDLADAMSADIDSVFNKVLAFETLVEANATRKLEAQARVGLNTHYLMYQALHKIFTAESKDKFGIDETDKQLFDTIFKSITDAELCNKYYNISVKDRLLLKQDEQVKVEQEICKIANAIHEFNVKTKGKYFQNTKWIEQSFLPKFNLFAGKGEPLTEITKEIDDMVAINMIYTMASYNVYEFKKQIQACVKSNPKMCDLISQEMSAYTMLAPIINQKPFDAVQKAELAYLTNTWKALTTDQREQMLKAKFSEDDAKKLAKEENIKAVSAIFEVLRYSNLSIGEGAAGTGKTSALLFLISEVLKNTNNGALMKNPMFIHGDTKRAQDSANSLGIKNSIALGHQSIWDYFFVSEFKNDWIGTKQGISTNVPQTARRMFAKDDGKKPSVIFLDEFTQVDYLTLDALLQLGIPVIATGDTTQISSTKTAELIPTIKGTLVINPNTGVHFAKLGKPMRTNNDLQTQCNSIFQEAFQQGTTRHLPFYTDKSGELIGTRIWELQDQTDATYTAVINTISGIVENNKKARAQSKQDYTAAGHTDGSYNPMYEKVGYICLSTDDPIISAIRARNPELYDELDIKIGDQAQGLERAYYVTELQTSPANGSKELLRYLYTAVTRSQKGTLLIFGQNLQSNDAYANLKLYFTEGFESTPKTAYMPDTYSEAAIARYNSRRSTMLDEILKNYTSQEQAPAKQPSTTTTAAVRTSSEPEPQPEPESKPEPEPKTDDEVETFIEEGQDEFNNAIEVITESTAENKIEPQKAVAQDVLKVVQGNANTNDPTIQIEQKANGDDMIREALDQLMWYTFNSFRVGSSKNEVQLNDYDINHPEGADGLAAIFNKALEDVTDKDALRSFTDHINKFLKNPTSVEKLLGLLTQYVYSPTAGKSTEELKNILVKAFISSLGLSKLTALEKINVGFAYINQPTGDIGKITNAQIKGLGIPKTQTTLYNSTSMAQGNTLGESTPNRHGLFLTMQLGEAKFIMPIACQINPITVIEELLTLKTTNNVQAVDPAIVKAWEDSKGKSVAIRLSEVYTIIKTNGLGAYDNLTTLIELFLNDQADVVMLADDFYPSIAFSSKGPTFASKRGIHQVLNPQDVYNRGEEASDATNSLSLELMNQDPRYHQSSQKVTVYASATGFFEGTTATISGVDVNNVQTLKDRIYARGKGHPFVLIHSIPPAVWRSYGATTELDYFIMQQSPDFQKTHPQAPTMRAFRVMPPSTDVITYISAIEHDPQQKILGDCFTLLKIWQALLYNAESPLNNGLIAAKHFWSPNLILIRSFVESWTNRYKQLILLKDGPNTTENLNDYQTAWSDLRSFLYNPIDESELSDELKAIYEKNPLGNTSSKADNVYKILRKLLRDLVYFDKPENIESDQIKKADQQAIVNAIKEATKDIPIFYKIKAEKNTSNIHRVILPLVTNNGQIEVYNKVDASNINQPMSKTLESCYIFGKVDTPTFKAQEAGNLLSTIKKSLDKGDYTPNEKTGVLVPENRRSSVDTFDWLSSGTQEVQKPSLLDSIKQDAPATEEALKNLSTTTDAQSISNALLDAFWEQENATHLLLGDTLINFPIKIKKRLQNIISNSSGIHFQHTTTDEYALTFVDRDGNDTNYHLTFKKAKNGDCYICEFSDELKALYQQPVPAQSSEQVDVRTALNDLLIKNDGSYKNLKETLLSTNRRAVGWLNDFETNGGVNDRPIPPVIEELLKAQGLLTKSSTEQNIQQDIDEELKNLLNECYNGIFLSYKQLI